MSTSTLRLLPYLANFLVLMVLGLSIIGLDGVAYMAWGFLPLLGALFGLNALAALGLLLGRRGGLAASFAMSAVFVLLLAGVAFAAPLVAMVTGGKIGG